MYVVTHRICAVKVLYKSCVLKAQPGQWKTNVEYATAEFKMKIYKCQLHEFSKFLKVLEFVRNLCNFELLSQLTLGISSGKFQLLNIALLKHT